MKPVNILLAEDSPTDVKIIEWVLEKELPERHLFKVGDGQQALDFIFHTGDYEGKEDKAPTPDLILLDITMPKVDGIEVLRKVKADQRFCDIHVVILTHSQDEEDLNKSFEHGAVSFVRKTETYEELHSVLELFRSYWTDKHGD